MPTEVSFILFIVVRSGFHDTSNFAERVDLSPWPQSATAHADLIMGGLITFRGNIRTWRDYLGYRLRLSWNEDWFLHGLASYGPIYQVFKAQGIELSTLAKQVLTTAKSALDNSLISKQTYEQYVKWFLEN